MNPVSAQISDTHIPLCWFDLVPKLWSEPTVLAWCQAGHRATYDITGALLHIFWEMLQRVCVNRDYSNLAFTALAWMGRPSASAKVTTTSFRLDRPSLLRYWNVGFFTKSSTESPENIRAQRPVGNT